MSSTGRLALVSFLILFLELLLIRLIGTQIRIFAYLGNLILLSIFVGSGVGMYLKKPLSVSITAIGLFFISVLTATAYILRTPRFDVKLFSGISELLSPLSEAYIWQQLPTFSRTGAVLGLVLTYLILFILAFTFLPLGNLLGRLLRQYPHSLTGYSVNITASLAGMWAFQLFSNFELPPLLGIVLSLSVLPILAKNSHRHLILASLLATIALTAPKTANQPYEGPVTFWSPYQKLTLSLIQQKFPYQASGYYLEVNNIGYMGLLDLASDHQATASSWLINSQLATPDTIAFLNQYNLPYLIKPHPQDVLIIGAGAGNDAAGAIRNQAQNIDAVEIDPVIIRLGKDYHPEKPYHQPSVHLVATDGRAFMETTPKTYDLIVMGLADSHTLSSSLTNLRLDHYLYTQESLSRARQLLNPGGVLVLSFEIARPWIGQRLSRTIANVFGYPPASFEVRSDGAFGWGGYFFVVAKDPSILTQILHQNPNFAKFINLNQVQFDSHINPLTDDWPYLYLDQPRLPLIHLLAATLLIISLVAAKSTLLKSTRLHWPMFFWGAAFLLLEFQNISKASLLFGLTWQTNLIIITFILLFLLLANWVVAKNLISLRSAFIGLLFTILIQFFIPLYSLNRFSFWVKVALGGSLINLPFFFGAIIFASWFVKAKNKSSAFASNLLGSAIGGLLEMVSFLTGVKSLLILTAVLYATGWAIYRRQVKT